jgi:solute:Na+ symporter, SSS family
VTRREKTDEELRGLVYGLTRRVESSEGPWWQRPSRLGAVVLALVVVLNIAFW